MNRIVLLTTEGCEGCSIMKRIVSSAYLETRPENTSFGCYDFQEQEVENIVKEIEPVDYPTTIFIKDNKIIFKLIGSTTKDNIIKHIKEKLM